MKPWFSDSLTKLCEEIVNFINGATMVETFGFDNNNKIDLDI